MPLPKMLAQKLLDMSIEEESFAPGRLVGDVECEGSAFHSPTPLMVRSVDLVPWSSDIKDCPFAWVCGVCADNLSVFQAVLYEMDGRVHYTLAREFGNKIRQLGQQGWDIYQSYLRAQMEEKRTPWRPGQAKVT